MATSFADTSFWIALSSRRDQYHSRAVDWHEFVIRSGSKVVTTEAILWEWLNDLADASTRGIAAEGYRRAHADRRVEVVPFDPDLTGAAVSLFGSRTDKDWSLTDCLSFVVMHRRDISEALTTDHHFEQAGLKALMLSLPGVLSSSPFIFFPLRASKRSSSIEAVRIAVCPLQETRHRPIRFQPAFARGSLLLDSGEVLSHSLGLLPSGGVSR